MKFLSAKWKHLLLATYRVDPEVVQPFVPAGTTLDQFDGHVFLSLVAFLFDDTRVLGIPVPFHRTFEEVNLRFYVTPVKDRSIRAVSFIKEIVPSSVIPWVANNLFHEKYASAPMDHGGDGREYWYSWGSDAGNLISGKIDSELVYPEEGSLAKFITEHYWGYSQCPKRTLEYRVEHPPWKSCQTDDFTIAVDFAGTYGEKFAFLSHQQPYNVQYAEGSAVTVSFPRRA